MRTRITLWAALSIGLGLFLGSKVDDDRQRVAVSQRALRGSPYSPKPVARPSFMSPHAAPLVLLGAHVFVVNTPADTVDRINIQTGLVDQRIHVGVDPVSIAVRPDGKEIWVSNHISDSVSVIDTNPERPTYLNVIATIQQFDRKTRGTRFDEPVGIAFASNQKAYVALSSENRIAVIDVATREVTHHLKIRSQDPRQLVVRNGRLYVIPFESNNQTQLSGGRAEEIDGDLVTFDAWDHSVANNNVLSLGHVVDIVKHPDVPDRDLFVFDTGTDQLVETVDTLGTLLYGIAVDSRGDVFIAQTDARNEVNGRAGTEQHGLEELENRAFLNRVTRVRRKADPNGRRNASADPRVAFFDLEPLPPRHPSPADAVATPFAIALSDDDRTAFVTAAGSDKLVSLDTGSGEVRGSVRVGGVPRGIVLDSSDKTNRQAWVYNAIDNSVSRVDATDPADLSLLQTIQLEDPTDPATKRGRKVFNSASASTTGTFSCASCHPDGHTDQLLWVLKTPVVTGGDQIMPRSTMPIRGLRETEPFHWDGIPGDPYGGINSASIHRGVRPNSDRESPHTATRHLVDGAQGSTMAMPGREGENDEGKPGRLSAEQRNDLAGFLLSVPYPPAPRRAYTNELTQRARKGFELFHISGDEDPARTGNNVCGDCHRMPNWVSTNTPGTGMDAPTWRGAYDRWLILPQGRLNIIEFDFFRRVAEEGLDERSIWQFSWGGRSRFDPVWDMVLEGSTGFSGAYARQATLNPETADDPLTLDLLEALESAAGGEAMLVQVVGTLLNERGGRPVVLQFAPQENRYREVHPDHHENESRGFTRQQLISRASKGGFVGTFTAHISQTQDRQRPQPVLWTHGPVEQQRGHQEFPWLYDTRKVMKVSGRHIDPQARIMVNGRQVTGNLNIADDSITIALNQLPPVGIHMLQVQNPDGLVSNDFLFYVAENAGSATETMRRIDRDRTDSRIELVEAASRGDLDDVRFLLDQDARVNARHPDSGSTALSAAALHGHVRVARLLLDRRASVSRPNRDGNTPLHVAAFLCRFEMVRLLLDRGASVDTPNDRRETAIDVVTADWSDGLAGFYQAIARSSGIEIELDRIQADRRKMAEMLGRHANQTDR